jgi:hypothetical protein
VSPHVAIETVKGYSLDSGEGMNESEIEGMKGLAGEYMTSVPI